MKRTLTTLAVTATLAVPSVATATWHPHRHALGHPRVVLLERHHYFPSWAWGLEGYKPSPPALGSTRGAGTPQTPSGCGGDPTCHPTGRGGN